MFIFEDNFIWLSEKLLSNFAVLDQIRSSEMNSKSQSNLKTSEESVVFITTVTILHEFIHFKFYFILFCAALKYMFNEKFLFKVEEFCFKGKLKTKGNLLINHFLIFFQFELS
jgi:hypothetical protein